MVGATEADDFGGRSAVVDPWGRTLYEGGEGEEGAFICIEPRESDEIRGYIKAFDMRRPELYRL